MSIIKKYNIISGICLIIILVSASQGSALFRRDLQKAKDYMKLGVYPHAVPLLERAVIEHPMNAEVNYLLGLSYINTDDLSSAGEVFAVAVQVDPGYGTTIAREYKNEADKALFRKDFASARRLFEKAVEYNPGLRHSEDERFSALLSESDNDVTQNTGSVSRAGDDNPVKKVFEEEYTFDDAFEEVFGQIKTIDFASDDIKIGDEIEVTARLRSGGMFSGKEIGIWLEKKGGANWIRTVNGRFSERIEELPGGSMIISLAKRKDISVTVAVKRYAASA